MMKRSHFLVGGAAGVTVAHQTGQSLLTVGIIAGLAALLPDVDHPQSAVGRLLPGWWHRLTPGHRGPTHSLGWCALIGGLVYLAQQLLGGGPSPLLAAAVTLGCLSHILADGLTEHGVPLWYPRRHKVVLLGPLAFKTGGVAEALVVCAVLVGAGWWTSQ